MLAGTRRMLGKWRRRMMHSSQQTSVFSRFAPEGHFYSPIPDIGVIGEAFPPAQTTPGIELREPEQIAFLDTIARYHGELPFADEPGACRFGYRNDFFGHSDAITLFAVMREFRPRRIIEVGSGYSSAVMLDTRDRFLPDVEMTFIEPFPERLQQLVRPDERINLLQQRVQDVPLALFESLASGDVLFIDSSHVSKLGSDVNDLFFRILPVLAPGVLVHVHDILWPFEYPQVWIEGGRAWNEAYLLRAFLQFNSAWEILYFNSFMGARHAEVVRLKAPLMLEETGGSIWLQRCR